MLEHMILECPEVMQVREKLFPYVEDFDKKDWIFGKPKDIELTQLIWVLNFVAYKAHLIALVGKVIPLETQIRLTCKSFSHWLECLEEID